MREVDRRGVLGPSLNREPGRPAALRALALALVGPSRFSQPPNPTQLAQMSVAAQLNTLLASEAYQPVLGILKGKRRIPTGRLGRAPPPDLGPGSGVPVGSRTSSRPNDRQADGVGYRLCAVAGARNGLVYGAKVRFPHALVMAILFGRGSYVPPPSTLALHPRARRPRSTA